MKDPYYMQHFLWYKGIRSKEIYINIERTVFDPISDEFIVKVAEKPEDQVMLELGFEYVCQKDGLIFLGKSK